MNSENSVALGDRPAKLAIFASGRGSNAEKIIQHLRANPKSNLEIGLIVSNSSKARVQEIATRFGIPFMVIKPSELADEIYALGVLKAHQIHGIVLAGFLKMIPKYLIYNFPKRILNIHPSLLPQYGGQGMYGMHVHRAVFSSLDEQSGITIHLVNEAYDEGAIIFQASRDLATAKNPEDIAALVLELEHFHYPRIIIEHFSQSLS